MTSEMKSINEKTERGSQAQKIVSTQLPKIPYGKEEGIIIKSRKCNNKYMGHRIDK